MTRAAPQTFCLVVEGEKTERLYFEEFKIGFQKRLRSIQQRALIKGVRNLPNWSLVIKHAGGMSFENVADKAYEMTKQGHEVVWCVVDADFFVRLTGKQKKDAQQKLNRARNAGVKFFFSRPCFEVWFRHHFESHHSAWKDGDTAKTKLAILWPDYLSQPSRHWSLLEPFHEKARKNAKLVRNLHQCDSSNVEQYDASSAVDLLFDDLDDIVVRYDAEARKRGA